MKEKNARDLTKGSPARLIFLYSIPILIGNVFQQLYSMVDTIIVGKAIDMDALAAVGNTGPMSFLIIGFITGITGGFAVIVAQRFGAKDEQGLRRSVAMNIMLSLVATVIMTVISVAMTMPLLKAINTPDEIIKQSYDYIIVIFWGIFATVLYNLMACILRALGDSKTPLYFLILSSFLNIALDFAFILVFKMGVAGAAWATVVSQAISGVLCLIYAKKKYPILNLKKEDFTWSTKFALAHLKLGLPMAFQFSITAVGVIVLQGALNLFGPAKMAAYTAATKVDQLLTQPAGTFGVTMANYTGQNLGANRIDRIKDGVKKCTFITLGFSLFATVILYFFSIPLASIFIKGNEPEIMSAAQTYLRTVSLFYPFLFMIFVYRNTLQGLGRSFMPLMAGVFELIMRTVVALTLPAKLGFIGVCLAGPLAWIGAAVPLAISYFVIIGPMVKSYHAQVRKS